MKIKLIGKALELIRPKLEAFGITETDADDFDVIVTHGGDGALLGAERNYPGVPKFPLRDAATAELCPEHRLERRLDSFVGGGEAVTRLRKLSGSYGNTRLLALNDVFLRNSDPVSAVRYRVWIDGELYAGEVVGDGVGMASVHGSSAYYRSITHSLFRVGIGLAFNNSTEEISHLVLAESSVVRIEVIRGPAILIADNSPERINVPEHGVVEMRQSSECAEILGLAGFMCPRCRALRHPNKLPFSGFFPY